MNIPDFSLVFLLIFLGPDPSSPSSLERFVPHMARTKFIAILLVPWNGVVSVIKSAEVSKKRIGKGSCSSRKLSKERRAKNGKFEFS